MKILIAPVEIAGIAHGLAAGFQGLGLEADMLLKQPHPFNYSAKQSKLMPGRWWSQLGGLHKQIRARNRWLAMPIAALHRLLAWPLLFMALARYDAVVYLFGESITKSDLELKLLRWFKKKSVVVFVGSDSRPPYIDGGIAWQNAAQIARLTRITQNRVRRFEKAGIACINAPATGHFQQRPFINWFALGFPCCLTGRNTNIPAENESRSANAISHPQRPRVLHCPSHPTAKGSREIETTVRALLARGVAFEWVTLSGVANAEIMKAVQESDLVVDQLYSDTPLAGLATEAARHGKAVIVGSYLARSPDLIKGRWNLPPSCFVDPDHFEQELERLIRQPKDRKVLGEELLQFVNSDWCHTKVAERLLKILKGEVPTEWWVQPGSLTYLEGYGLHETVAKQRVRDLIDQLGPSALCLEDKPELANAFEQWCHAGFSGSAAGN